jgi:hypothetical protein
MLKLTNYLPVFLLSLLVLTISVIADEKKDILGDWDIKLTPKENNTLEHTDKPYDDVLTLKGDKISTKVCTSFGFESVSFTTKNGKKVEYTYIMKSAKHGRAIWKFSVNNDKIEGAFSWEKDDKKANFTFKGERNKEDKKKKK